MFDMSATQQQAALDAMNGESASSIMHVVLYSVGVMAVIWLLMVVTYTWQGSHHHHHEPGTVLLQVAWAVLIVVVTGALIVY